MVALGAQTQCAVHAVSTGPPAQSVRRKWHKLSWQSQTNTQLLTTLQTRTQIYHTAIFGNYTVAHVQVTHWKKNSLISQQAQTSHSVQMLWLKVTLLCCVLGSCTCRQVCFSWRMNMDSGRLMLMWLTLNVNWSQKLTLTLIVGLLPPGKNLTVYGIVFTNIGI